MFKKVLPWNQYAVDLGYLNEELMFKDLYPKKSMRELATMFNVHRKTIRYRLDKYNIPRDVPPGGSRYLNDDSAKYKQIIEHKECIDQLDLTVNEIKEKFGITSNPSNIYRILKENNIKYKKSRKTKRA